MVYITNIIGQKGWNLKKNRLGSSSETLGRLSGLYSRRFDRKVMVDRNLGEEIPVSISPSRIRIGLVAALIGLAGFAAVASTSQAQMAGSFYQAPVKAGKSKCAASK
ncbi:MAG: hypothetical protein ACO3CR_07405, partial [Solirubrobacterales bacterium]